MSKKRSFFTKVVIFSSLTFVIFFWDTHSFGEHWGKTFGGDKNDHGSSIQQTTDGGYIIAGSTWSTGAGLCDVYLIKTDANGNELWSNTFGGDHHDFGRSVQQTTDGGYIIAGNTDSFGAGLYDVYLIKTDANGNELWSKTFGGDKDDVGKSVQQTTDGSYIIAGSTWSIGAGLCDVYLIKTDANGNKLWSKTFGGDYHDVGRSVQRTTDSGYIIVGDTESFGAGLYDVYLIKTDTNGNELWSKTFGGDKDDVGKSVQQTTDGGYIIAGYACLFGEDYRDVYLIKTDANGNELWSKTFGGDKDDHGNSVQQTTDGGYIIVGTTGSFGAGLYDVYLIKTDTNGNELWSKTFGGVKTEWGGSVQLTTDGGYIIVGDTYPFDTIYNDVYLIYYKEKWQTAYNTLFDTPSDLELFRQYRDKVLTKTDRGNRYKNLLYQNSEEALAVLLDNPELIAQAKDIIYANKDAVWDVTHGDKGIIFSTEEILAFLDAYAKEAPPKLKFLAKMVKRHMLIKQRKRKLFFGFRTYPQKQGGIFNHLK